MSEADTLSIGWARSQAEGRQRGYRRLLAIDLAVRIVVGLVAIIVPSVLISLLGLDQGFDGNLWVRAWGGLLVWISLSQLPAYLGPTRARLAGVVGIAGRGLMAVLYLFLWGGFLWLAAYELLAAVLLYRALQAYGLAEIMTRP